jgi:hypothetical protein
MLAGDKPVLEMSKIATTRTFFFLSPSQTREIKLDKRARDRDLFYAHEKFELGTHDDDDSSAENVHVATGRRC